MERDCKYLSLFFDINGRSIVEASEALFELIEQHRYKI